MSLTIAVMWAGVPYNFKSLDPIANILAGPLIERAPSFASVLTPGGTIMLAGLLDTQADAVRAAYAKLGMREAFRVERGDWPTLVLRAA